MAEEARKKPKFFFARAFGAREALSEHFGGGRGQKQSVREPVRWTLCSFMKYYRAFSAEEARKSRNFSSLAPSALARHFLSILVGRGQKQSVREPVRFTLCSFLKHLGSILVRFLATAARKKPEFFFARASGVRDALSKYFGGKARPKLKRLRAHTFDAIFVLKHLERSRCFHGERAQR